MDSSFYTRKLASIGIPFSLTGEVDQDILPERALCDAAPIFYESHKSCSMVYTLLFYNYDFFVDDLLAREIAKMTDPLAAAMLGGILYKSNKGHFMESISLCRTISIGCDTSKISRSLYALTEYGRLPLDSDFENLFGIRIAKIEFCDKKKTTPREYLSFKNKHFEERSRPLKI